jgi:hypothetical protein
MRPSFPLSTVFALFLLPSSWALYTQEPEPRPEWAELPLPRTFTIIGLPVAALLSGLTAGIVTRIKQGTAGGYNS